MPADDSFWLNDLQGVGNPWSNVKETNEDQSADFDEAARV